MELNPSISGWVSKFRHELYNDLKSYSDEETYFLAVVHSGLLYGKIVDYHLQLPIDDHLWSEENKAQFCLFTSALSLYQLRTLNKSIDSFFDSFLEFYKALTHYKKSWFEKILPETKAATQVEDFINQRIINKENFFLQAFSYYALNVFLFLEIIYFDYFLKNNSIDEQLFKSYEKQCLQLIQNALDVKVEKNANDVLFIKLFKKSSQYNKEEELKYEQYIDFSSYSNLQKMYVLNLCHLVFFKDDFIHSIERKFLTGLEGQFQLASAAKIERNFLDFLRKHSKELPYLTYDNSVKKVYNRLQDITTKTLLKNKNRLALEISQSKELFHLLMKSRNSKLTKEEKKKVKQQLKDILKTIPSLTIFLLPGGGLLLPILIKFIPEILPSAFNENLER